MIVSEYDAFGPWIYEISEEHPLPALFAPHYPQSPEPIMSFKIPRDIERRRATPDMELYDYVIAAYEHHILILKREGKAVSSTTVAYEAIEGIRLFRKFLLGLCTLYLSGRALTVTFNTTSMQLMQRFVRLIRSNYQAREQARAKSKVRVGPAFEQEIPDALFINLQNDLRDAGECFQTGAFQPAAHLLPRQPSLTQRLFRLLKPQLLPSALHLFNDDELLLIVQENAEKDAQESEYGYDFTYIPLHKLQNVYLEDDERYQDVTTCTLKLENNRLPFSFSSGNQQAALFYQNLRDSV